VKINLIYPKWPKIEHQTEFNLPPHGPVCFAATIPGDIEVSFCDENRQEVDFSEKSDLVALSVMLTCQIPRAWEIADKFRALGIPVIFGGIGTMLHHEETRQHADSVFLGEADEHFQDVVDDLKNGSLKKIYNYFHDFPDIRKVGPARRSILKRELYNYRGVQMVDLVHASRGCKFKCFPCCSPFLGGQKFRPRDVEMVIKELETIDNNRLFFVDNSMAQDVEWTKKLFKAMIPLKKKWISHPIKDDDMTLDLAAEAGCWYVYQAIFDTSDYIRRRIRRLKDRGIGIEGTIILGMDNHDEDYIKRLIDFLLEVDLDLAEFTVLTPYPHTSIRKKLEKENRILHNDWTKYTSSEVVYKPALMSPEKLNEMYHYSWDTFYDDCNQEIKMAKLFVNLVEKEKKDGTYTRKRLKKKRNWQSVNKKGMSS
jgi:radical SAM superfamily enzyme YgiQ (UPF0313 family)